MLKKFFVSLLGSMAAIWLSFFIFLIGIVMVVAIISAKSIGSATITGDKILYINLSGSIPDRESEMSISDILYYDEQGTDNLEAILTAIQMAADDKEIKGIYIDCAGSEMGIASRSEVVSALKRFHDSGKWIYAYADEFAQGDYYIASVADKVFLNPVGMLDVHGLSSMVMFYKDLLDKVGVEVNVVRVGTYKSAVEPFMRMDMSEASRRQTSIFLTQIWDDMTNTIADNRGITSADVNLWADSLSMTWAPERYIEQGAVTQLCYRSEVEDMLRSLIDVKKDDDLPLITPTEYLDVLKAGKLADSDRDHIAVLYAVGDIVTSGDDGIASESMVPQIQELADDKHVKGLILRVNSPGGSAFASEQIWHALEDFKATGKPFYVSMGDYAASGGYYISCGADRIFCDPSTLTGSIGIFGIIPNAENLLTKKVGLGFSTVETNKNANFPSLYSSPTAEQLAAMQKYVERGYDTFTSRVAQGRDISVDSVKVIGSGRVWDGQSALKIGLVDELGGLFDAIEAMADDLDLKANDYVSYPKTEPNILQTLMRQSAKNVDVTVNGIPAEDMKAYADFIDKIKNIDPLQMRMETVIIR